MSEINIYGTDWCEDTQHTVRHLESLGVPFDFINIDEDTEAASWVQTQNEGRQRTPTIDIEGLVLSVPSDQELDEALRTKGILS